jgi:hypothetical protein
MTIEALALVQQRILNKQKDVLNKKTEVAESEKMLQVIEAVERSKRENPNPPVFQEIRKRYHELKTNQFAKIHTDEEFNQMASNDELMIRIVAESSKIDEANNFVNYVYEIFHLYANSFGGLETIRSHFLSLLDDNYIAMTLDRRLILPDPNSYFLPETPNPTQA